MKLRDGALLVLGGLLAASSAAVACTPHAAVWVSPSSGPAGTTVTVNGKTFSGQVEIRWNSTGGRLLGTAPGPDFSVRVSTPADASPGVHTILVLGKDPTTGLTLGKASSPFEVAGPTAAEPARATGQNPSAAPKEEGAPTGSGDGATGTPAGSVAQPGPEAASVPGPAAAAPSGPASAGEAPTAHDLFGQRPAQAVPLPGQPAPAPAPEARRGTPAAPRASGGSPAQSFVREEAPRPDPAPVPPSAITQDLWGGFGEFSDQPAVRLDGSARREQGGSTAGMLLFAGGLGALIVGFAAAGSRRRMARA